MQSDYHWWEDYGVPDQIQKNTYLSRYVEPPRASVKHVVFLASGQRLGKIKDNLITGQRDEDKFKKRESSRNLEISTESLAFRLFDEGIYSTDDTFAALAFDARFNWGFSKRNKSDIVNAYFAWLKSKFESNNLQSVYLAGHSRGGALVLRLAKKFQEEFPNVAVIVDAFDPVPNKTIRGELGAFNSSIDNPVANFPRDTALSENKGNWAWKSNLRTYYGHKKNFSVFNMLIGGKIFGLAQETRAIKSPTRR
ncbi:MAG: alpha/beta hydrolase, partial [Moorea sp. SIO2B7]|nr:alpha/beta hydrolase [Moorena sp. SIO2B7]